MMSFALYTTSAASASGDRSGKRNVNAMKDESATSSGPDLYLYLFLFIGIVIETLLSDDDADDATEDQ